MLSCVLTTNSGFFVFRFNFHVCYVSCQFATLARSSVTVHNTMTHWPHLSFSHGSSQCWWSPRWQRCSAAWGFQLLRYLSSWIGCPWPHLILHLCCGRRSIRLYCLIVQRFYISDLGRNNHYDSIIDATFGRCYLASLVVSDDVAGRDVGVSSPDSSGCVKRRRVFTNLLSKLDEVGSHKHGSKHYLFNVKSIFVSAHFMRQDVFFLWRDLSSTMAKVLV